MVELEKLEDILKISNTVKIIISMSQVILCKIFSSLPDFMRKRQYEI
jgi:hypothetical protein